MEKIIFLLWRIQNNINFHHRNNHLLRIENSSGEFYLYSLSKIERKYFLNFHVVFGYPHCSLWISELRGRVKAWFDAQGRDQTNRGLRVYIIFTMVSTVYLHGIWQIGYMSEKILLFKYKEWGLKKTLMYYDLTVSLG